MPYPATDDAFPRRLASLAEMIELETAAEVRRARGQRRLRHARQPARLAARRHRAAEPVAGGVPGRPRGARPSPTACSSTCGASSAAAPRRTAAAPTTAPAACRCSWARRRPAAWSASSRASRASQLDGHGNLRHTTDFRAVYKSLCEDWFRRRRGRDRPDAASFAGAAAAAGMRRVALLAAPPHCSSRCRRRRTRAATSAPVDAREGPRGKAHAPRAGRAPTALAAVPTVAPPPAATPVPSPGADADPHAAPDSGASRGRRPALGVRALAPSSRFTPVPAVRRRGRRPRPVRQLARGGPAPARRPSARRRVRLRRASARAQSSADTVTLSQGYLQAALPACPSTRRSG